MLDRFIASLKRVGPSKFPRFAVVTTEGDFWTGCDWSPDLADAELYADSVEPSQLIGDLQRCQYSDLKCVQRHVVPITVEVMSDEPLDEMVLREWLRSAATLFVDYAKAGNGPVPECLVLLAAHWHDLRPNSGGEA